MTPTRFFLCRAGLAFGYSRKNLRMTDASAEMHLLKEAETHLGEAVWKKVENIEALSAEYWNLRKLSQERDLVAAKLRACQDELDSAHANRSSLLAVVSDTFQDLTDARKTILDELEELAKKRDLIVAKARDIRRSYDGFKTKLEVIEKDGNTEAQVIESTSTQLAELKKSFTILKKDREAVAKQISEGDDKIRSIDADILTRKKDRRENASAAFQNIGEANQQMSAQRTSLGLLDAQMRVLYLEVGRYVSRKFLQNPECTKAATEHRGMIEVMDALRESIQLNQKLADLS